MSNVIIDKNKIDLLANAIAAKSGESLPLTLAEMVEAVDGIQGGGGVTPTGNINITQSGVTDVTDYATATVADADIRQVQLGGEFETVNYQRVYKQNYMIEAHGFFDGYYGDDADGFYPAVPSSTYVTPTETAQTVGGYEYMMEGPVTVSAIPSNYVGSGVTQRTSSDLTASGATVTAPAGYYANNATKSVASGTATPAATISATSATLSTGTNTLTLSKTVSNTPQVSAGYVSSGTAGNSSVSLTASVTTKAAATITPGTSNQTIANGTYLTGAQTISGDANLIAGNIKSGVSIFGVAGTYSGGGTSKNAQTVQQSSTRITSTTLTKACGDITVAKTGTYDVYWSAYRTSTSGTWGTQLYIGSTAYGSKQSTFTNSYYQAIHLSNVSLTQNQTISVYGQSRGSNYYLYVGQLTIIEA